MIFENGAKVIASCSRGLQLARLKLSIKYQCFGGSLQSSHQTNIRFDCKLMEDLKFKHARNKFQDDLKRDVERINSSKKVLVFGDKTRNLYELEKKEYEKLLRENITKTYRKTDDQTEDNINHEIKQITTKLGVNERVEKMAQKQAFIFLKDHKENFENNSKCRLINPANNNLGLLSKQVLLKGKPPSFRKKASS